MTAPSMVRVFDVDSPEYFTEAATSFQRAQAEFERARRERVAAVAVLQSANAAVEQFEAEVVANGGLDGQFIDGKNAEQRTAQLRVILANSERYHQLVLAQREAQQRVAELDAEIDIATNEMRIARIRADYATASVNARAVAYGGRGLNGHS